MFCVGITFFLRQHQTDKHVPGHGRRTFSHFLRDSSSPLCLWSLCAAVGKHYSISRWSWWEYRWDWSPSPGWARQSASGAPVVDLAATTPTMMSHSAWLDSGVGGRPSQHHQYTVCFSEPLVLLPSSSQGTSGYHVEPYEDVIHHWPTANQAAQYQAGTTAPMCGHGPQTAFPGSSAGVHFVGLCQCGPRSRRGPAPTRLYWPVSSVGCRYSIVLSLVVGALEKCKHIQKQREWGEGNGWWPPPAGV